MTPLEHVGEEDGGKLVDKGKKREFKFSGLVSVRRSGLGRIPLADLHMHGLCTSRSSL